MEPVFARHLQVENQKIDRTQLQKLDGGLTVRRFIDLKTIATQEMRQSEALNGGIIADQYSPVALRGRGVFITGFHGASLWH